MCEVGGTAPVVAGVPAAWAQTPWQPCRPCDDQVQDPTTCVSTLRQYQPWLDDGVRQQPHLHVRAPGILWTIYRLPGFGGLTNVADFPRLCQDRLVGEEVSLDSSGANVRVVTRYDPSIGRHRLRFDAPGRCVRGWSGLSRTYPCGSTGSPAAGTRSSTRGRVPRSKIGLVGSRALC
jgi:hypothetical protein